MSTEKDRPKFKSTRPTSTPAHPEELFYKLSGRAQSHGYLRGPQQDVLREYADKYSAVSDIALELPTGTGKTAVGLLIAEWWRQKSKKVAFLCLTNQLASQILIEAHRLTIPVADLRGTKYTRYPGEEGKYRTGGAVAVTTYSNLFNVNPVLKDADLLVFDDAHGAEQYVASMWTVSVNQYKNEELYNNLLSALQPGLTLTQLRSIMPGAKLPGVELVDSIGHPECILNVTATLDSQSFDDIIFPWGLIREHIDACLFLVSKGDITIRPIIPPTYTHAPFADAKQRIFMSATLGGASDLQRAYCRETIHMVRARSPQWGRRYVFVPGVFCAGDAAEDIVATVWDGLSERRAVMLAPSSAIMEPTFSKLHDKMIQKPKRITADKIADTLDSFILETDVILTLEGRYDGLDLPDDHCRLLVLIESPASINAFERHLRDRWKMGPVLKKRERTRLIQGMGRCTRNATDFAIIVWLGQSLVDAATSSSLLGGLPLELAAEIQWGVKQSEISSTDAEALVTMILELILDPAYRQEADEAIDDEQCLATIDQAEDYEKAGADEVRFTKAMWDANFGAAHRMAHAIADTMNGRGLSGYRAWWWYLASKAAALTSNASAEQDCLSRGSSCGVNSGWLSQLLQQRINRKAKSADALFVANSEALWDLVLRLGWAGPSFEQTVNKMLGSLNQSRHSHFHEGLDLLGQFLGADTTRTTEQGCPDVIWSFPDDMHIAFEAKTEKKAEGLLSKNDLLEAKGHADWIKDRLCKDNEDSEIYTIVVAPQSAIHEVGLPFAGELYYLHPDRARELALKVTDGVRNLRLVFAGREFSEAQVEFSAAMHSYGLDVVSVKEAVLGAKLLDP